MLLTYPSFNALRVNGPQHPTPEAEQAAKEAVETLFDDGSDEPEIWHCCECHHPITHKANRLEINQQHCHTFANPHGYLYQIGCFAEAPGCIATSPPTAQFSWFPGYTWQIGLCKQCSTFLGWAFRAPETQFWGLILDQLV